MGQSPVAAGSVLVLGATGSVGSWLVRTLSGDGVPVIAVGRNRQRLREVVDGLIGVHPLALDLSDADEVAATLAEHPLPWRPELAVAALGGWYVAEETTDLPHARWDTTLRENLTAHFVAARCFAPLLGGARPSYVALNGIASHYPCTGSVAISVAGAGQRMLLDVLAAESIGARVRFGEVVIDRPVVFPGDPEPDEPFAHPEEVLAGIAEFMRTHPGAQSTHRVVVG